MNIQNFRNFITPFIIILPVIVFMSSSIKLEFFMNESEKARLSSILWFERAVSLVIVLIVIVLAVIKIFLKIKSLT